MDNSMVRAISLALALYLYKGFSWKWLEFYKQVELFSDYIYKGQWPKEVINAQVEESSDKHGLQSVDASRKEGKA